ncbi:MAG: tRNA dimethylallyltransferase [Glaciecola sp.]|jgi:tRNA dimethylallyltransferase
MKIEMSDSAMLQTQPKSERPQIITIMGPTASGKTALAIELASKINGEIISVDSALIYRGMDIGTAKPGFEEQAGIKHWLIDIVDPQNAYSVAEFCRDSQICIEDILQRGKVPILVGGTMMYFNGLIKGLSSLPNADQKTRTQIQLFIEQHGLQAAHKKLSAIDPESGKRIHENDPQRIMRALEVYALTSKTMTSLQDIKPEPLPYEFTQFSLMPNDRTLLHERIVLRFDTMLQNNFEQEVTKLRKNSELHLNLPSMRSVGYRQMWQYLSGEDTFDDMREKSIIATRQLAKRQITWLRGWEGAISLQAGSTENVKTILQYIQ